MHRNTYLVVTFLAVFAALVVGVNLGKRLAPSTVPTPTPSPQPKADQPLAGTPPTAQYTNEACGFSFAYPTTLTPTAAATESALFIHATDKDQSVVVACQAEIPRPPLPADKIERRVIYNEAQTASVSARLYHDASAKDGTVIDELIFRNPRSGMDVFIAGFGETFNQVIATLKLL